MPVQQVSALRRSLGQPPRKLLEVLGYKLLRQDAYDQMKRELRALRRAAKEVERVEPCVTSSIINYLHARPKVAKALVQRLRDALYDDASKETLDAYLWRLEALVCKDIHYRDALRVSIGVIAKESALDYELEATKLSPAAKANHCAYGLHMLPPSFSDLLLERSRGRVAIDGGAYDGGTSRMLIDDYGASEAHAFEPVSFELLTRCIADQPRIVPVHGGLYRENLDDVTFSYFDGSLEGATMTRAKEHEVPSKVYALDEYAKDLDVGCVKLDVEGAEYDAILGMKALIQRCKPALLISVYHTGRDLFEIQPMLKAWVPEYRFLLRHIRPFKPISDFLRWEYLLYAI